MSLLSSGSSRCLRFLDMNPLSDKGSTYIFSGSLSLRFLPFGISLGVYMTTFWWCSSLFYFFSLPPSFPPTLLPSISPSFLLFSLSVFSVTHVRSHYQIQCRNDVSLFFSKDFIVSACLDLSPFRVGFFFIYSVRCKGIVLQMTTQFFQNCLLIMSSLFHWFALAPLSKIIWAYMWGCFFFSRLMHIFFTCSVYLSAGQHHTVGLLSLCAVWDQEIWDIQRCSFSRLFWLLAVSFLL